MRSRREKGFTLVELIVTVSVISVLMSIIIPAIAGVRRQANQVVCMSNMRQLGFAFVCYASDNDGYAVGACDAGSETYWWGQKVEGGIDHTRGPLWDYMRSELEKGSVYECPSQRFGTYMLQGKPAGEPDGEEWITSTYGYNGYYLSPPASGWGQISHRPWQKLSSIRKPGKVIVFADSLMDWDTTGTSSRVTNIAYIDPPKILSGSGKYWQNNGSPTTCFRHNEKSNIVFADLHCEGMMVGKGGYSSAVAKIGSVSEENGPYYVPDWESWAPSGGRR